MIVRYINVHLLGLISAKIVDDLQLFFGLTFALANDKKAVNANAVFRSCTNALIVQAFVNGLLRFYRSHQSETEPRKGLTNLRGLA